MGNTQGVPDSAHDVQHDDRGATKVPDVNKLPQGTKPPELKKSGEGSSRSSNA